MGCEGGDDGVDGLGQFACVPRGPMSLGEQVTGVLADTAQREQPAQAVEEEAGGGISGPLGRRPQGASAARTSAWAATVVRAASPAPFQRATGLPELAPRRAVRARARHRDSAVAGCGGRLTWVGVRVRAGSAELPHWCRRCRPSCAAP